MIRRQVVQWILLPGGLTADGQLAASVFVAPRLRPDATASLADFPDFADWPALLGELELEIVRPDGATEAPISMSIEANPTYWGALFPAETIVRSFRFDDLADRPLVSYPVQEVLAHLRNRWAELAFQARDELPLTNRHAAPIGPPQEGAEDQRFTLGDHFGELRGVFFRGLNEGVADAEEFSRRLRDTLDGAARQARSLREAHNTAVQPLIRPFGAGGNTQDAFAGLVGFHARPSTEEPKAFPTDARQVRSEFDEKHDFHHLLSTLGDHPALLRSLGLVIDLQIRPDFVPFTAEGDPPVPLRLQVRRRSAFPARSEDPAADVWNVDATPATWCRLADIDGQAVFSAVERSARQDFAHGFLHLDPARYSAAAVDVDGLAMKALNLAATLERQDQRDQRPVEEPAREGVPTARTGGIGLVHTDHAEDLHEDFYAARSADDALEADPEHPADLAAEELVRGYRVDIQARGSWRSLHQRRVVYRPLRDGRALEVEDEGHVQLSLTSEVDRPDAPADPDRALYTHEVLTTWDGWSLAAPRPGSPIVQEPAVPDADPDLTSLQLEIDTEPVPGTLPRLRFGEEYRLRVRTVDLAGQAHSSAAADQLADFLESTGNPRYTVATPAAPLVYRRFEPVPPPELVPRWVFGPGEGVERLVIRSTPGITAKEYAEASAGAEDEMLRYHETAERHLLAGKAPLALIEAHGLLDEAFDAVRGLDPDAAAIAARTWYDIATRESGSVRAAPGARFVATGTHQPGEELPPEEQGYVCLDADTLELPYLPDPLGVGAMVRLSFDPAEPELVIEARYPQQGAWYSPLPLRLTLAEGAPGAEFDPDRGVLSVRVAPGRTATLRLSSLFEGSAPENLGIVGWCREELSVDQYDAVVDAVVRSAHWMTTPWRDLMLVHASQRPLFPSEVELDTDDVPGFAGAPVLARNVGETTLHLRGRFRADMPSTAQVDLQGVWTDVVDDPGTRYATVDEMSHVVSRQIFSLPIPEPFGTPWQPEIAPLVQPLDAETVAFRTRAEQMDTPNQGVISGTPESIRTWLRAAAGAAGLSTPERRRLEAGAAQIEQLRSHEFGDTRYRRVAYTPVAATRFREYFDPHMPTEEGNSAGSTVAVEVLSSAQPAKPVILQVLPLLSYDQARADDVTTSRRNGLGLRVWLGRPWFTSGAGELLAVVCDRGGPLTESSDLSREITLITGDPAHGSVLPLPLRAGSFEGADVKENVRLAGGGSTRDLACFAPVWDAGRQAWYVDLRFETGEAYFPFVRLGLARYQSESVPGCVLSPMVSTAFVQTLPDRSLSCTHGDGTVAVSFSGPAPTAALDAAGAVVYGGNEVVAVIEGQPEAYTDPLLGWAAISGEAPLAIQDGGGPMATYAGTIAVPPAEGQRRRLVVSEYESHPADDRSQDPAVALVATRRLVHVDVIPL